MAGSATEAWLQRIEDPKRRADAAKIAEILERVVGVPGVEHPGKILGFGRYHYRYASGHEGDSVLAGMAPRTGELVLYVLGDFEGKEELLARLGKHRAGKGCLYLKKLDGLDLGALEEIVRRHVARLRELYPA